MSTIQQRFEDFHAKNPDVYVELVALARRAKARGRTKIGIGMLFEIIRWNRIIDTNRDYSGFKLNNIYRSRYARLIQLNELDLLGFFDTRELQTP